MASITLIHGDAAQHGGSADLILTDPPYDLPGRQLAAIIERYQAPHLVMLTTMRQLLEFMAVGGWQLNFDFVFDAVMPKQSRSRQQPNYMHQTGVYLTRPGVKSVFNRQRRQRSDVFEANGYWPTIFHAPRENLRQHGMAKNTDSITDLLGSFEVASVLDPFAGSGTTGFAALELGLDCTLIDIEASSYEAMKQGFRFIGAKFKEYENG